MQEFSTNIVLLAHEKESEYLEELLVHLKTSMPKGVTIFSMKDILPGEESLKRLYEEFIGAEIVMVLISSNFLWDNILHELRDYAIYLHDADRLELIQVLARSVHDYGTNSVRAIKTLPKSPLSTEIDKHTAYAGIVSFVLDKIDIIRLKSEIIKKDLEINRLKSLIYQ